MKIINRTDWDTGDLQRLIRRTMKEVGIEKDQMNRVVVNKSRKWISGRAWRYTGQVEMCVPNGQKFRTDRFVQVLVHEFHHILGLHHEDMVSSFTLDYDWTKKFRVNKKEQKPKPKPKEPIQITRHRIALRRVKEKEAIIRRNQKLLRKWNKKVKYYEKELMKKRVGARQN